MSAVKARGGGAKETGSREHLRLPSHCVTRRRRSPEVVAIQRMLRRERLHSVCEEARCPNLGECWSRRHVTFMLLGSLCTRACRFCAVETGRPVAAPDPQEPQHVAEAARRLALSHVVLTSVNRDDLPDGGAAQFAATVRAIRRERPDATVEVLTPDFQGDLESVGLVCGARPHVFNHNVETVPRLYARVRPGARFERSLRVLREAGRLLPGGVIKSGFMVGLGETFEEVLVLLRALRDAGVHSVTAGQYLQPTRHHLPVARYWEPEEFDALAEAGRALGLAQIASGPLVRSSYNADETFREMRAKRGTLQRERRE